MKTLILVFISFFGISQTTSSVDLSKAIGAGDVTTIAGYMDDVVEVCVLDVDDFLDKADAINALNRFYKMYSPSSFKIVHKGVSKGKGSRYMIGNMKTNEDSFRVFIAVGKSGGKDQIKQIRFEIE